MPVIEQKTTNKNKVDFDLNRLDKSKTTIFSKYPVLYLHRHLGRSHALGGRGHLLSVGGGDILDGRSASPSAAALEDGMPGGGTGVAVGAGISVCLVDLFTAPHRPVPGPSDRTLRDTVEKRRCPFGTAPSLLFLVEVEIAAIPAGPQCLGAAETDFFQVTEGVIVTFTEKTADCRTAA